MIEAAFFTGLAIGLCAGAGAMFALACIAWNLDQSGGRHESDI